MDGPYRYWAFISYSHADAAWSDWLFKALETYRLPRRLAGRDGRFGPVPSRLYPVFRDRDELGGSSELSASLIEALKASRCLVVICSPRAARSRWVDEEIRQFEALGGKGRILALIADGEPHSADPIEECFPPALRASEPIAADVRPGRETRQHALLKLVAGIVGVPLDELIQRERQRIRARRLRLGAGAIAASVIAALAGSWLFVNDRIERHLENGRQAMLARDFVRAAPWLVSATSMQERLPFVRERPYLRAMLGLAMAQLEQLETIRSFPGTALGAHNLNRRLDKAAIPLSDGRIAVAPLDGSDARIYAIGKEDAANPQFDDGDRGIYYTTRKAVRYLDLESGVARDIRPHPEGAVEWSISPLGHAIHYQFKDRHEILRVVDGSLLARLSSPAGLANAVTFDARGEVALVAERGETGRKAMIVDLVRGGIARTLDLPFHPAGRPQFDSERKRVVLVVPRTARSRGVLSLWNYETGRELWTVPFPAAFRSLAFSPDGKRIATTSMENRAVVWDADTGHVEVILDSDAQIRDVHFFADSVRLLTMSQDGSPRVWNVEAGGQANKLEGLDAIFAQAVPLPDGASVVAIRTSGAAQLLRWRLDGPNVPRTIKAHKLPGATAALAAADTRFVTQDEANEAAIWNVNGWKLLARIPEAERWALSRDGRWFAAVSKSGVLRVHDVASGSLRTDSPRSPPLKWIAGWSARDTFATLDEEGHATLFEGAALKPRALGRYLKPAVIEMSRDGSRVAVVANRSLEVLDAVRATRLATFDVPEGDPWGIDFSDDGQRLVVNYSRVSQLMDVGLQRKLALSSAGASATLWAQFLCNGDYAALTLGNHRFQLHDARTGERLRDFEGAAGIVGSLACDREAGLISGSDLSGTMTVWRLDSGQPLARFTLASARLWTNAWIASTRTVAVAAEDANIYLVPIPIEKRPVDALEASLRCRVAYRVSGDALVRDSAPAACSASR